MQDAPPSPAPRLVVRFDVEIQLIEWPRKRVATLAASVPLALASCQALGVKAHFFVGRGALALLPALVERILSEGHDLDLLVGPMDHPEEAWEEAVVLLAEHEHNLRGVAGFARSEKAAFALPALADSPSSWESNSIPGAPIPSGSGSADSQDVNEPLTREVGVPDHNSVPRNELPDPKGIGAPSSTGNPDPKGIGAPTFQHFPGPPEVIARHLTRHGEKPDHWPGWEEAIREKIEAGYRIRTMREILHESR